MLVHVKVKTESRENKIVKKNETSYIVYTKEKAENNRANSAVVLIVAEYFNVTRGGVKIITGHHAPSKILEVVM